MSRTVLLRVGACGLALLAIILVMPKRPANANAALAHSLLLDSFVIGDPFGMDPHSGDGFSANDDMVSGGDPNIATLDGFTILPCAGSGGGGGGPAWPDVESTSCVAASAALSAVNLCDGPGIPSVYGSAGPTLMIGDAGDGSGSGSGVFMGDVIYGPPCPGGPGDDGGGGSGGGCGGGGAGGGGGGGAGAAAGPGAGGGGSGGPAGCLDCDGGAFSPTAMLHSILLRFPLGNANEWRSAGVIRLSHDASPSSSLGSASLLEYDLEAAFPAPNVSPDSPVNTIRQSGALRQIRTPDLLADITTGSGSLPNYWIRYYSLDNVGAYDTGTGLYPVTDNTEFRAWNVQYDATSPEELLVTVYVRRTGESLTKRVSYLYTWSSGAWSLRTLDSSDAVLRLQEVTPWSGTSSVQTRTRTIKDGSGNLLYKETEERALYEYANDGTSHTAWRRTQRVVDPDGAALTTTWKWVRVEPSEGYADHGLVLESVHRPNGSWTWYTVTRSDLSWIIDTIHGRGDADLPTSAPSITSSSVSAIRRILSKSDWTSAYELSAVEEYDSGTLVGKTEYVHTPGNPNVTEAEQWTTASGDPITTTYEWHHLSDSSYPFIIRIDKITEPDGRVTEFTYDDDYPLSIGSFPNPHGSSGSGGYHYHVAERKDTSGSRVSGKSTQSVWVTDAVGRPWFNQTSVWTGSGFQPIGWTARTYDAIGRVDEMWQSNGAHVETSYPDCCARVVVGADGVSTTTWRDALGRISSILREAPGQTEITTSFNYATARQISATVAAGSLSQTSIRKLDLAGRLTSSISNSGTAGALQTLTQHEIVSGSGEKITVYHDYAESASSGTAGLRDEIREYRRDGKLKRVSGSAVVERNYESGAASNETWLRVITGDVNSTRRQTQYFDMLGRTAREERPGWIASGTPPMLTTTYHYDSTGELERIEAPGQADTLYVYDEMGAVKQTVLDVNGNGTVDLGGPDRITEGETIYESADSQWWQVTRSYVYPPSSSTRKLTGSRWTRQTGFTGSDTAEFVTAQSRSYDVSGNLTTATVKLERDAAVRTVLTDVPESTTDGEQVYEAGRLATATSTTGVTTTYAYDDLGRQTHVTNGRGNTTQTSYDSSGRVEWTKDGAQNQTDYGYYAASDSGAGVYPGRLKFVEDPADKRSYFGYNDRGQTIRTWGHVPNPTENVYDGYGQRTTLKTFRGGSDWDGSTWPGSPGDSDDTTWTFHEATGLLNQKTYDDGTSIVYTYTSDGKLYTRKWARNASDGKVTTYTYDADTGELTDVDYDAAWSMTDLAYTYDRLGRRKTVTDAAGARTFAYDPDTLQPTTETFNSGLFSGKLITQVYQDGTSGTLAGRWAGVQIGTANDPDADYAAAYGFDAYGRLNHVTGPGLPTGDGTDNGAWYSFETGSELVDKLLFKNSSATVKGWVDWSYEDDRDLVAAVENSFGDLTTYTTISKYAYGNDSRGRREHVVRTGSAFASSHMDLWQYNDRNELTRSERHAGTDPNSPGTEDTGLRRVYAYDPIGNRSTSTEGTGAQTTYTSNNLNQYDPVVTATSPQTGQRLKYDLDGNLTEAYVTGDINGDGNVDMSDLGALLAAYGTCEGQQGYNPNANISPNDPGPQCIDMSDLGVLLSVYGLQATGAIRAKFTWDAENRLVGWEPLLFVSGAKKVEFKYDYFGRRIEKKVYTYNGSSWSLSETRRFIWNNWLLLLELDGDGNVLRKLTWGRDLSGSLDGAGGIGGLLAVQDANGTTTGENHESDDLRYVCFYDANGNVGQVIDLAAASASASIKAHYEYDAYGNVPVQSGSYASANPYRFSTKPWDDETGLGSWGLRYYDPRLGRWSSPDPLADVVRFAANGETEQFYRIRTGGISRNSEGQSVFPTTDIDDDYRGHPESILLLNEAETRDPSLNLYEYAHSNSNLYVDPIGLQHAGGSSADKALAAALARWGRALGRLRNFTCDQLEPIISDLLAAAQEIDTILSGMSGGTNITTYIKMARRIADGLRQLCNLTGPKGGKGGKPNIQCVFFYEWCVWANGSPPDDPGRGWKRNAPCNSCFEKCAKSGKWPFGDCPMGGPRGPRWPGPKDNPPCWPGPGDY